MIKRAEVTLELETGEEIDYSSCTDAEKEFITVLAAIYAICFLTGGSAVGLSFSVGDQNVSVLSKASPLDVLQSKLERILTQMKGYHVGKVQMAALDNYLDFILNYAPYLYYISGTGVDTESGRAVSAASFAIDFLCETHTRKIRK